MPAPISITSNSGRFELTGRSQVPASMYWGEPGTTAVANTIELTSVNHRNAERQDEVTVKAGWAQKSKFLFIPVNTSNLKTVKNPTNWGVTNQLSRVFAAVDTLDLKGARQVKLDAKGAQDLARTGALLLSLKGAPGNFHVIDKPFENPALAELLDAAIAVQTAVAH